MQPKIIIDYDNFFESLKYHVGKKGHGGQALICRHTDIPTSYLSRILKKNRRAGLRTQKKISKFFGFDLEEFVEMGRRITLGEDPESAVDLLKNHPVDHLMQRLTEAVRKEIVTANLLSRTQLLYEDIVENSRQIIARFDSRQKITFANRACGHLLGIDRSILINVDWKFLFNADYHPRLIEETEKVLAAGGTFSLEVPLHALDIWVMLTVTLFPQHLEGQDLGQLVGFDITEKKKLVDRLHFIQHGIDMSFVPTLVIGDSANIIYVNQAVCNLLGYSQEELAKLKVWDINPLIPEDSWRQKWAWFEKKQNIVFDGEYRTKTGDIIKVEFHVSNLKYPDGRRYNVVLVKPRNGRQTFP